MIGRRSFGGDERTRTADPLLAKQVLYQLSYVPEGVDPRIESSEMSDRSSSASYKTQPVTASASTSSR